MLLERPSAGRRERRNGVRAFGLVDPPYGWIADLFPAGDICKSFTSYLRMNPIEKIGTGRIDCVFPRLEKGNPYAQKAGGCSRLSVSLACRDPTTCSHLGLCNEKMSCGNYAEHCVTGDERFC